MKKSLLSVSLVLSFLIASFAPAIDAQVLTRPFSSSTALPARTSAAASDTEGAYLLTWRATATGEWAERNTELTQDAHRSGRQRIEWQGSTVLRYDPGSGLWSGRPFASNLTDYSEGDVESNYNCSESHDRATLIDPTRYTGLSSPDFFLLNVVILRQPDGAYTMEWPVMPLASALYSYRNEGYGVVCTDDSSYGESYSETTTRESYFSWDYLMTPRARIVDGAMEPNLTLTSDTAGKTFSKSVQFEIYNPSPASYGGGTMMVTWEVEARRLGECGVCRDGGLGAAGGGFCASHINDTHPAVNSVDVAVSAEPADIRPDEPSIVTVFVTCDGVPVQNAAVEIGSIAVPGSGGHAHDYQRPRGYLDGTKITSDQPYVVRQTNDEGKIQLAFVPPRDENCVDCDLAGISGTYFVAARAARFPQRTDGTYIQAGIKGLRWLSLSGPETPQLFHPLNRHATQAVIDAVFAVAGDFANFQRLHNQTLAACGASAWPIVPLLVGDASLSEGGLFDLEGDWHGPYTRHGLGRAVDLGVSRDPEEERAGCGDLVDTHNLRTFALNSIAGKYGTMEAWQAGHRGVYHFEPSGTLVSQATGPDLGVGVLLSGPSRLPVAAAGQRVTLTIGVDNLTGSTAAANTALTATLPAGLQFISAHPAPVGSIAAGQPFWELGTLDAGTAPRLIDLVVQTDSTLIPGTTLALTAETSTSSSESPGAGNARASAELTLQSPGPDLVVSSDIGSVPMTVDQPVTVTMHVANHGNSAAAGTTLDLSLPVSVTLQSASPAAVSSGAGAAQWALGDVPAGGTQTITATLRLDPNLRSFVADTPLTATKVLTYGLQAATTAPEIDPGNNSAQVVTSASLTGNDAQVWLSVEGAGTPGTLTAGQEVTYTVHYANYGNQIAPTTTVTLSLGSGLSFLSADSMPERTATSTQFPGGVFSWDVGDLGVGASGSLPVRVRVDSVPDEGSLSQATIQTEGRDSYPRNNGVIELRRPAQGQVSPSAFRVFLPVTLRGTSGW